MLQKEQISQAKDGNFGLLQNNVIVQTCVSLLLIFVYVKLIYNREKNDYKIN